MSNDINIKVSYEGGAPSGGGAPMGSAPKVQNQEAITHVQRIEKNIADRKERYERYLEQENKKRDKAGGNNPLGGMGLFGGRVGAVINLIYRTNLVQASALVGILAATNELLDVWKPYLRIVMLPARVAAAGALADIAKFGGFKLWAEYTKNVAQLAVHPNDDPLTSVGKDAVALGLGAIPPFLNALLPAALTAAMLNAMKGAGAGAAGAAGGAAAAEAGGATVAGIGAMEVGAAAVLVVGAAMGALKQVEFAGWLAEQLTGSRGGPQKDGTTAQQSLDAANQAAANGSLLYGLPLSTLKNKFDLEIQALDEDRFQILKSAMFRKKEQESLDALYNAQQYAAQVANHAANPGYFGSTGGGANYEPGRGYAVKQTVHVGGADGYDVSAMMPFIPGGPVYTDAMAARVNGQALWDKMTPAQRDLATQISVQNNNEDFFTAGVKALSQLGLTVADLPHLASGGTVAESGMAVIHKGETVVPAGQGSPITIHINNPNINGGYDIQKMVGDLQRELQREMRARTRAGSQG